MPAAVASGINQPPFVVNLLKTVIEKANLAGKSVYLHMLGKGKASNFNNHHHRQRQATFMHWHC